MSSFLAGSAVGSVVGGGVATAGFTYANKPESKGGFWESVVYFTEDAENLEREQIKVRLVFLLDYFATVDGITDQILEVAIYSERLQDTPFKTDLLSHTFLIIKSENYYWSFEKMSVGIFVQRSKSAELLKQQLDSQVREDVELKNEMKGISKEIQMLQVFIWMKNNPGVFKCYHYLTSNCQSFSQLLFKEITDGNEFYSWVKSLESGHNNQA